MHSANQKTRRSTTANRTKHFHVSSEWVTFWIFSWHDFEKRNMVFFETIRIIIYCYDYWLVDRVAQIKLSIVCKSNHTRIRNIRIVWRKGLRITKHFCDDEAFARRYRAPNGPVHYCETSRICLKRYCKSGKDPILYDISSNKNCILIIILLIYCEDKDTKYFYWNN
jgi:hypothetical protein